MVELKYYGFNACMALWQQRAEDIIRVYLTTDRLKECGALLKWCAARKKAYHIVSVADLEKIASSVHHEGMMILARSPAAADDHQLLDFLSLAPAGPQALLFLDGVENPHNIGSITRVAAHFGAAFIIGRQGQLPRLSPSAARVAEGGAEFVRWAALKNPEATLSKLLAPRLNNDAGQAKSGFGFTLVATSSHARESLYAQPLPERVIFVLGGETSGASASLLAAAKRVVAIPGTSQVESLNVAVATGLLLGEHWRQHCQPTSRALQPKPQLKVSQPEARWS